jgi:hypothetical protein
MLRIASACHRVRGLSGHAPDTQRRSRTEEHGSLLSPGIAVMCNHVAEEGGAWPDE